MVGRRCGDPLFSAGRPDGTAGRIARACGQGNAARYSGAKTFEFDSTDGPDVRRGLDRRGAGFQSRFVVAGSRGGG